MTDFLLAVVAFLIVLGPLVLIHEFGHFIAARLVGITVLEFGIGFPPRARKLFEQGGTIFTLNWLPIGGFVRPLGEDFVKPLGPEATAEERAAFEKQQAEVEELGKKRQKTKSVQEATPLQRIFFMVSGAGMNFIGAFVLLVIASLFGQLVPKSATVTVFQTVAGSPATAGLQAGDVITALNGKPVTLAHDVIFAAQNSSTSYNPIDLTVKRGDKTLQVTVQPADPPLKALNGVAVLDTAPNSPAAAVLKPGDVITKVDNVTVKTTDDLKRYVDAHTGQTVTLTFQRSGEQMTAQIIPRTNPPSGEGALGVTITPQASDAAYAMFGLILEDKDVIYKAVPEPINVAATDAWTREIDLISQIVNVPARLIRGEISPSAARPVGPAGIGQMAGQVLQESIAVKQPSPLLEFAALISVALAITNLLPIPPLDGSRILFVLVEIVRGKPINPERESMVHLVGMMLLLGLSVLLVINDLIHPINLNLPR
jgi:regulator of sigma E protease